MESVESNKSKEANLLKAHLSIKQIKYIKRKTYDL